MSDRKPGYAMHFADFMLRIAKQRDRRMASDIISLITDSSFEMNTFKEHIRSLADYEEVCTRRTKGA